MIEQMLRTIKEHNLLQDGQKVLVGVSGGVDSMALLNALMTLETLALDIYVVHVHHGIRGETADRDLNFVKSFCEVNHLVFEEKRVDVPALSKEWDTSIEDAGRRARYKIFSELTLKYAIDAVALAHHRDDVVETFLMNLFRGAGIDGLTSIDYVREPNIIRPLLDISKNEIYQYCRDRDIQFIQDESNEETAYLRNRIRLELLPYLRDFFDYQVDDKILATVMRFKEDKVFWSDHISKLIETRVKKTKSGFVIEDKVLETLTMAEKRLVIRELTKHALGELKDLNQSQVDQIIGLDRTGTKVDLKAPIFWTKLSNGLALDTYGSREEDIPNLRIRKVRIEEYAHFSKDLSEIGVDADKIVGKIYLRHRLQGDRFFPYGNSGSKKLKDFMIDLKIPRHIRDSVWLVCDDEKIIWIPGYRMSEEVKITEKTQNVVMIRL